MANLNYIILETRVRKNPLFVINIKNLFFIYIRYISVLRKIIEFHPVGDYTLKNLLNVMGTWDSYIF